MATRDKLHSGANIEPPTMKRSRVLRRKADYVGRRVRLRVPVATRLHVVPAGTVCDVTRAYGGLHVRTKPCLHCGVKVVVTHIPYHDVDLLED